MGTTTTLATTIWEVAVSRAAETPDARFAVDEHGRELTFAAFVAAAESVAAGLADLGVGEGDVVSWQLPSRLDTMILAVALCRLGAVQNPLVAMLREGDVAFICRQAGSRLLVVPGTFRGFDHAAMAHAVADRIPGLRVLVADGGLPTGPAAALGPPPEAVDPAGDPPVRWLFYTSGTTSDPKGARHTDRGLLAATDTFCRALEVTPRDRTAALAPVAHVGGIAHILTSLRSGGSLVVSEIFDPGRTVDLLVAQDVTLVGSGLPFIRAYLARQREVPTPLFPHARAFLCGGSPRPPALHYEVKRELGSAGIVSGYGLTECPYLTWGRIDDSDEDHARAEGGPAPGAEAVVVRADGTRADDGEIGEIRVRAPQLMLGYVDRTLDADAFDQDGYFRTGDLGFRDARSYLTITGRLKDVIIRNMENVSAREVEEHLAEHKSVLEVAVIGVPDPRTGERVCAVVVPGDPDEPPTLADLCDHLLARGLSTRKLPERLEIVDLLPRNAMGKVVKPTLRTRFGA